MKVVLSGATGFVGSEVLSQLLAHPAVTQVTCITRRPLPESDRKLVTILHEDFAVYDDPLIDRLADHAGAIWTLGGKASDIDTPEEYERVTHTFTIAFATALAARVRGRFSFCYLSGMSADPSESSRFPWEKTTRHLKGRTEKDLLLLRSGHDGFTVCCFRPGGVLPNGASPWIPRLFAPWVIKVEELAKALVRAAIATEPSGARTFENAEIKAFARGT